MPVRDWLAVAVRKIRECFAVTARLTKPLRSYESVPAKNIQVPRPIPKGYGRMVLPEVEESRVVA